MPKNSGRKPKLTAAQREKLRKLLSQKPDSALADLQQARGADVHVSRICRAVQKLELTLKKVRHVSEQDRLDVAAVRAAWHAPLAAIDISRLVFLDERKASPPAA